MKLPVQAGNQYHNTVLALSINPGHPFFQSMIKYYKSINTVNFVCAAQIFRNVRMQFQQCLHKLQHLACSSSCPATIWDAFENRDDNTIIDNINMLSWWPLISWPPNKDFRITYTVSATAHGLQNGIRNRYPFLWHIVIFFFK